MLGTDFITDIALLSMDVAAPLHLKPGHYPTDVALRTVSEAIAKAGSQMLEIEPGELMAEYRPSLTPEGREGLKAEISYMTRCREERVFRLNWSIVASTVRTSLELMKTCPENCDARVIDACEASRISLNTSSLIAMSGRSCLNIFSLDNCRSSISAIAEINGMVV